MPDEEKPKIKRTHTFSPSLLERLERLARSERRNVSMQLAILLEDALDRAEKKAAREAESESGNWEPALMAA